MKYFFHLSLYFLIQSNIAFGCLCNEHKRFDVWDFLNYTRIVKGVVLSIEEFPYAEQVDSMNNEQVTGGGYQRIKIKIEDIYKGNFSDSMVFKTELSNGVNCTKTFTVGEEWYIFSSWVDGENVVQGCSWSQRVNSNPKLMSKVLPMIKEISVIKNKDIEKKYLDRDCSLKRVAKGRVVNGQAEGFWVFLDKKGNPYMTGYYSNGVPVGLWKEYYMNAKNFATKNVAAKSYVGSKGNASIRYNLEGEVIFGTCNSISEIPSELFSFEEVDYLKTRVNVSNTH